MTAPVSIERLSKTYRLGFFLNRRVRALQDLSLELREGEVFGLLGPNGAGKSTAIKILMNLVQPSSGTARLFGHPPAVAEARRQVGFLPENPAPYEYLTGHEFVRLAALLSGMRGREAELRSREVLAAVGMERAASIQIRRYSKGMIQRVALAQAIVNRPRLLILDEPTSGLDPVGRREMRDLILAERARGTTVLFCTHIIPDVEALCDRVAVLVGSRLMRHGTVSELLTSQSPLVEMTVLGVPAAQLRALAPTATEQHALGDRVLLRVPDADAQAVLRRVLDGGGRVSQLQPVRSSLEDLFMKAIEDAGTRGVGGEIG